MLSEEEKKAIERLEKRIKDNENYKTTQVWLTDDVVAVNIVLNLVNKLQKENKKEKDYINKIGEEFLKYDWKTSNKQQIINQLKSLYYSIFGGKKE